MAKYNEYLEEAFETDDGKVYLSYNTEEEGEFEFAMITGAGIKINPKNKYKSYKVALKVPKAEAKRIRGIAQALWDEYSPRNSDDEPANDLVWERDKNDFVISPHCRTENANGDDVVIGIVDSQLNKLDPAIYGKIGTGSTGHASVNFTLYDEGVSMYLNGIQLVEFVPFVGGAGDGTSGFKAKEGKALDASGGKEFSKKDKKKKKKKKKD